MNILQQLLQKVDSIGTPITIDINFVKDLFPFVFPKDMSDPIQKFKSPTETTVSVHWPYVVLGLLFVLYIFLYMSDTIIFLIGFLYPLFFSHMLISESDSPKDDLIKMIKYWMLITVITVVNMFVGFPSYLRLVQVYMLIRDRFECVGPIYDGICMLVQMAWTSLDENFHLSRFFISADFSSRLNIFFIL